MLDYILLGFLSYRPMTGYELKSHLDRTTMHFWHAYHSQVYMLLRKMESDGWVISQTTGESAKFKTRTYSISPKGQEVFQKWLDRPYTEPPELKEPVLVRQFFASRRDPNVVREELYFQRQLHQIQLEQYEGISSARWLSQGDETDPGFEQDVQFWNATLEFGKAYEKMYLDWINQTLKLFENLEPQSPNPLEIA